MKLILRKVNQYVKHSSPPRLIAFGFASVILVGAILLMLPVSVRDDQTVSFIDALFTSTSAVCVTGLIAIDTAEHFTVFGRTVVALLMMQRKKALIPFLKWQDTRKKEIARH